MGTRKEACPYCGNVVTGEPQHSATRKKSASITKEKDMETALVTAGTVKPSARNAVGATEQTTIDMLAGNRIKKYIDDNEDTFGNGKLFLFCCPNSKCKKTWTRTYDTPEDSGYESPDSDMIKCIEYFEDFFANMLCKPISYDVFLLYLCGLNDFIQNKITNPIARSGGYLLKTYACIDYTALHDDSKDVIRLAQADIQKALDIYDSDEYKAYQSMCHLLSLRDNRDLDMSHYEIIKDTCPDILSLEDTFIDVGHTSERFNDIYTFVTEAVKDTIKSKKKNTANEQEYLYEVRTCRENGNTISSGERRLLDKLRRTLGISEERAAELERTLS